MSRATSQRYRAPYRPIPVRLFDRFGGTVVGSMALHDLLADAKKATGLNDFGDMSFVEPLGVLLDSIEREAELTPLGRFIQRTRIVDALSNRLRIEAYENAYPGAKSESLGNVIVIAALQRTGTTKLHRLLAADSTTRALRSWEAINPVPLDGSRNGNPASRKRKARIAQHALKFLAPDFFAIHPVEYLAPEEDVLLLDLTFMSQTAEAIMHVPSYAAWLEEQDHQPVYRYLRRVLKLLAHQEGGTRWVLKTPAHLEHLDALLDVFPEAKVVQTHRDPAVTMPSFASMVAHGRGIFSDRIDPHEVGRHWIRKVRRMSERALAARQVFGEERFLDIAYADLIAEPLSQVERIYSHVGEPLGRTARREIEDANTTNTRHKYGRHRYSLAAFGWTEDDIDRELGFLRERFLITREPLRGPPRERTDSVASSDRSNPLRAMLSGIADLRHHHHHGLARSEHDRDGRENAGDDQ